MMHPACELVCHPEYGACCGGRLTMKCEDDCADGHTYGVGCELEGSIPPEQVVSEDVQYEGRRPDETTIPANTLKAGETFELKGSGTIEDPPSARDILVGAIPADAFHDNDISGESWQWTTPTGIFRVLMSRIPEPAVVIEFKQPRARADRVMSVISVKNYTLKDVIDFVVPMISLLS